MQGSTNLVQWTDLGAGTSTGPGMFSFTDTLPPGVNFASDNSFSSGPNFFERLFGGPSQMTPPAPVGRRQQQRFTR